MTSNHQVLNEALPKVHVPAPSLDGVARVLTAPLSLAGRAVFGKAQGPRGYRREGFPEHELYQVMSGRRDRFGS